jgi:hypothetical protein
MQFKVAALVVGLILLALFATKPTRGDFDQELDSMLREAISTTTYDNGKTIDANLTAVGCKLRTNDCLNILRKTYSVSNKNFIFVTRHDVSGPGASIRCWGLLKQFVCDTTSVSVPTIRGTLETLWRAAQSAN